MKSRELSVAPGSANRVLSDGLIPSKPGREGKWSQAEDRAYGGEAQDANAKLVAFKRSNGAASANTTA